LWFFLSQSFVVVSSTPNLTVCLSNLCLLSFHKNKSLPFALRFHQLRGHLIPLLPYNKAGSWGTLVWKQAQKSLSKLAILWQRTKGDKDAREWPASHERSVGLGQECHIQPVWRALVSLMSW
jgi:hypothetical protein